ncbi:MAG: outer membrane beta-barrel protein [bacterium]|nr:outer membrane beta-barrel protein [bacterium]
MAFKMRDGILAATISIGISLCLPLNLLGAGNFIVTPKIAAGWQYDSNYWKSEDGEQEVFTYLIQPGIELGYETAKSQVSLNYTLNAFFYDDQESVPDDQRKASDDDYLGHTFLFQSETRSTGRWLFALDNSFYYTRNPAQTGSLGNFTDRDKYWVNRFMPRVYHDISRRFAARLRYRNEILQWVDGDNEDSVENRGIGDLIYKISPTAQLDLEYQHWQRDFDGNTSDYTSNQLRLILRKQFKYISFEAGGGYQDRAFDDSDQDDISTPAWMGAITGQWPPAPDRASSRFSLRYEQNFNDNGLGAGYYVARRLSLVLGHIFLEKIETSIEGWYQNSDYKEYRGVTSSGSMENRDDDTYRILGRVGYRLFDWMTFYVAGGYQDRDSNIDGLSYDNTFLRARIDCKYEF